MTQGLKTRALLIALSIFLTATIVMVGNAATAIVLGEPIVADGSFGSVDAVDVAVLHFVFTGIPFFVLAAKSDQRAVMWAVASILTAATWAYSVWRIWRASLIDFAGGADIGLGFIMMAAPFVILLILKGVSVLQKRTAK